MWVQQPGALGGATKGKNADPHLERRETESLENYKKNHNACIIIISHEICLLGGTEGAVAVVTVLDLLFCLERA